MGTRIPPPVYALLTAAAMWLLDRHSPHCRFGGVPWVIAGCGCTALGIGLPLTAMVVFLRHRTTINPMRPDRASRLIVSGIYRISRNPMYLGLVLSLVGWALLLGNPLCLLLVWLFVRLLSVVQIAPEEAALYMTFGRDYQEYSRQVNRWFGRRNRATRNY